jgi:hypothetical protein
MLSESDEFTVPMSRVKLSVLALAVQPKQCASRN